MTSPERLDGIACVVTGGAQGIGYATACELARLGAALGIIDANADKASDAAERLRVRFGCTASAAAADVSDADQIASAIEKLASALGGIGVLVNCAGIMTPTLAPVGDMPVADFDRMVAVHVRGSFLASRAALPYMAARGFGRIVNISSVLGILGLPFRIGYATAKTAIIGFTRSLAIEAARSGITVNAIAPGYILTETLKDRLEAGLLEYDRYAERAPAGRWGLPEEIGRVIAFLALPASGFITGAVVPVDGGYTIRGDPDEAIGSRPPSMAAIEAMFADRYAR